MTKTDSSLSLLKEQLTFVNNLEQLLIAEKEILQQQKPDELVSITEKKQALLGAIEQLDQKIQTNQEFLSQVKGEQLPEAFYQIEETLKRCKKQNAVNGQIIQHSALAVERIRGSILENRSRSSMTYDKQGKKSGGITGKSIKA